MLTETFPSLKIKEGRELICPLFIISDRGDGKFLFISDCNTKTEVLGMITETFLCLQIKE